MKILKLFKAKDIITIVSALAGFFAILFLINQNFWLAAIFLIISALLDYLDGKVARKVGPTKYGHYLDLADLSSFGVAPALFIIMWLKPVFDLFGIIIYIAAISLFIAGLLRLARFFTLGDEHYSIGVPITVNGIIFPLLWLFSAAAWEVTIAAFVMSYFMISTVRLKKH